MFHNSSNQLAQLSPRMRLSHCELATDWSRTHIFHITCKVLYQLRYPSGHPPAHFLGYLRMYSRLALGVLANANLGQGGRCGREVEHSFNCKRHIIRQLANKPHGFTAKFKALAME